MIEEVTTGKSELCKQVLDDLPEWFGLEYDQDKYVAGVASVFMIVAKEGGEVIGFIALREHG